MNKRVNLRRHNLNTLPVLREILRHGNLTKAATAMGLSQPALSNTLKQLRVDFGDPLFVRKGHKMQLTHKALELLGPLDEAMQSLEKLLSYSEFDPLESNREFRIATTDFVMTMLSEPLAALAAKHAPNVGFTINTASKASVQALMVGEIDMIIAPANLRGSGIVTKTELDSFRTEAVLSEALVCLARDDDEAFRAGLSLDEYLARPHAGFHFGEPGALSMERALLLGLGLEQNDKLRVSSYAALAPVVASSGYLALVPLSFAKGAVRLFPVQYAAPPFECTEMRWEAIWHSRQDRQPHLQWLRSAVRTSLNTGATLPDMVSCKTDSMNFEPTSVLSRTVSGKLEASVGQDRHLWTPHKMP